MNIFNQVQLNDYVNNIEKVTAEQVGKAMANLIKGTPTMVAVGGGANRLVSFDQI